MTATNHAAFGALVGTIVPQPLLAIPLALASHFVLDSLPHGGTEDNEKVGIILLIDITCSLIFLSALAVIHPHNFLLLTICAIVAMSPDIMWLPGYIREAKNENAKPLNLVQQFHSVIQRYATPWGYILELPWFTTVLCAILVLEK